MSRAARAVGALAVRAAAGAVLAWAAAAAPVAHAQQQATIARVKASVVAVGTLRKTRAPQFAFRGTGFVVADGLTIVTNSHVVPETLESGADPEVLAVRLPTQDPARAEVRVATVAARDPRHDLAVLQIRGTPVPALALRDPAGIAEGDRFLFTGFPIGHVLGPFAATHQAMIASIAPVALPAATAQQLNPQAIRSLQGGAFTIFQLDGTALPGNSGSPLYDPASGEVVGVVNMVFVRGAREAALAQPSGITYAIPSRHAIELLQRVRREAQEGPERK